MLFRLCVSECNYRVGVYIHYPFVYHLDFGWDRRSFFTINVQINEQAVIDIGKYRKTLNTVVTLNAIIVKT